MEVKDGRERQPSNGENHRRNYTIAAVCIPHSHSIISSGPSSLICKHNFSILTDKCRRYTRRIFSVLDSQNNLCLSEYWQFRYLSESID
jgi:hypothetical protein